MIFTSFSRHNDYTTIHIKVFKSGSARVRVESSSHQRVDVKVASVHLKLYSGTKIFPSVCFFCSRV
jgi:hypothetical protein